MRLPRERARDLGIVIGRHPAGRLDAITDVRGVRVGHATLNSGSGRLVVGKGPVRTGVTVIIPAAGDLWRSKLMAGGFVLNGNGEAAGLMWLLESGILETPIALTNTLSIGTVQKALVDWMLGRYPGIGVTDDTLAPLVFECDDSGLNDIRGQHVKGRHVFAALKSASSGPVAEGAVGAGAGMMTYEFKGGIGTASRRLGPENGGWTVGVLLNANHGRRPTLRVKGVPVGEQLRDLMPGKFRDGSIVIVVATDAPLESRQLCRLARRAMLGLARTGAVAMHGSGDVAIAFSTANRIPHYPKKPTLRLKVLSDFFIDPLFEAAAEATEEAVLNAMLAAKTTVGRDGNTVHALPHDRLKSLLARYMPVPQEAP
ncbi:MAG: P1 family peptidase [Elusimicrobia bacterium]|nr:P1 family peptidase [Elusimicrobiota bacterium]